MSQFRPLLITSITFTIGAAATWGILIAGVCSHWRPLPVDQGAAITFAVGAIILWLSFVLLRYVAEHVNGLRAEYRRREAALIRMADREPPTVPLPLT